MITFMQKHKKYLVITIWISVIAFVGASFVGWGSLDLNLSRSGNVAKVGRYAISQKEFNNRFAMMINYLNTNGDFDKEKALQMGLDKQILSELVREKLLLNYAYDLGISVGTNEIAGAISKDINFLKDGVFDKELYLRILKENRISPEEYENDIKKQLTLAKVFNLFNLKSSDDDVFMLASSIFMQDNLGVKVFHIKDIDVEEKEIKDFWENTKQDYLTSKQFHISYYLENISKNSYDDEKLQKYYDENKFDFQNENGEIIPLESIKEKIIEQLNNQQTKQNANLSFVALKNNEKQFDKQEIINENDENIFKILENMSIGDISKPFKDGQNYKIVKLDKIDEPREKTYEEAKDDVVKIVKDNKIKQNLEKMASEYDGKYTNIGFVSRDSVKSTKSELDEWEFALFIQQVFANNLDKSFVLLPYSNKAVAYKILAQKLDADTKISTYKDKLLENISQSKQIYLMNDVLEDLQKRYEIINYYKGDKS